MSAKRKAIYDRIMCDHGAILSRTIASYTNLGSDRDDLGQDVGLGIWKALKHFRGECSERTFVIRIAHNRGLSFVYQKRRKAVRESVDVTDNQPSPETAVGTSERREALFEAIRTLPLGYRQVLTLALEELPHKEIGQIVGISPVNVAVRLCRAKEMLTQKMRKSK